MRYLIALLLLLPAACAKHSDTSEPAPSCIHDPGAQMITYADGVDRKSDVTTCSYQSGKSCIYASFVNDNHVTYTTCR